MNKLNQIIIFLFAGLFLFGCSDDDQEFTGIEGKDRFISSFTLKIDGVSYDASIVGDKISIEVPYRVKLDGASAEYILSEGATINPDPSKLQDWGTEWKFVVTSNTKESAVYYYTYKYADIAQSGSVTLKTQEEVDKFANTGINKINGNLVIGTMDGEPIENLNGLNNLVEIGNALIINPSYKGENLLGLEKLETLGSFKLGSQIKYDSSVRLKYIELPLLRSVVGDFVVNSTSVEKVLMPKLENVGEDFYIVSDMFSDLDVSSLVNVDGCLTIKGSAKETGLATLQGLAFGALKNVGRDFTLYDFPNIQGVFTPELIKVGGNIEIFSLSTKHFIMSKLTEVGGISIESQFAVQVEFPILESCGNLNITGPHINKLDLSSLKNLYGDMKLKDLLIEEIDISAINFNANTFSSKCNYIKKIVGPKEFNGNIELLPPSTQLTEFTFDGFNIINGNFNLTGYNKVLSFRFSMKEIKGDVKIETNRSSAIKKELLDLSELETIGGSLIFNTNYAYPEIRFDKLTSIGTYCQIATTKISDNLNFPSLKTIGSPSDSDKKYKNLFTVFMSGISCPKLEKIYGDLSIETGLPRDLSIDEFSYPLLNEISGELIIDCRAQSNTKPLSLNFSGLRMVEKVSIMYQELLYDFSTFAPLFTSGALSKESQWYIDECGYNPTFQDMMDGKYKPAE